MRNNVYSPEVFHSEWKPLKKSWERKTIHDPASYWVKRSLFRGKLTVKLREGIEKHNQQNRRRSNPLIPTTKPDKKKCKNNTTIKTDTNKNTKKNTVNIMCLKFIYKKNPHPKNMERIWKTTQQPRQNITFIEEILTLSQKPKCLFEFLIFCHQLLLSQLFDIRDEITSGMLENKVKKGANG